MLCPRSAAGAAAAGQVNAGLAPLSGGAAAAAPGARLASVRLASAVELPSPVRSGALLPQPATQLHLCGLFGGLPGYLIRLREGGSGRLHRLLCCIGASR